MIVGNCFGSGCAGPRGTHVVVDYGDYLWCLLCDNKIDLPEPDKDQQLWWRYSRNSIDIEKTG